MPFEIFHEGGNITGKLLSPRSYVPVMDVQLMRAGGRRITVIKWRDIDAGPKPFNLHAA